MASLDPALAHVKSFATGSLSAIALRAETALEELLTNSVVHGNALSVAAHNESLKLRFEDAFAEFDPLAEIDLALQRAAGPLEQRRIGGLGLLMVYRLADEFLYMRANGRNCIELSFLARRLN
jgi:anti-sigma regulatory factor (Ser/Thr protein kinase)